jgi:ketosteroid isomerase-like protein
MHARLHELHFARQALAAIVVALAGCGGGEWQSAVSDVLVAERAFAARARDTTVQQAFLESVADTAVLFRPGPVDARTLLDTQPYPPDFRLEWEPDWTDASADGGLGYTTGPWSAGRRAGNSAFVSHGSYVTIWRRIPRRGWRVILDIGTGGAQQVTPREARSPALPPTPVPDGDSSALDRSIRLLDEDFTEAAVADSNALASFVTTDTRFLRDGSTTMIGAREATDAYRHRERDARWSRVGSGVSRAGDLGYVFGTWRSSQPDSATGAWLRIWRRDAAGDWKLALDAVTGSRSVSIP